MKSRSRSRALPRAPRAAAAGRIAASSTAAPQRRHRAPAPAGPAQGRRDAMDAVAALSHGAARLLQHRFEVGADDPPGAIKFAAAPELAANAPGHGSRSRLPAAGRRRPARIPVHPEFAEQEAQADGDAAGLASALPGPRRHRQHFRSITGASRATADRQRAPTRRWQPGAALPTAISDGLGQGELTETIEVKPSCAHQPPFTGQRTSCYRRRRGEDQLSLQDDERISQTSIPQRHCRRKGNSRADRAPDPSENETLSSTPNIALAVCTRAVKP